MAEERRHWTVIELLKWTADYLAEKKFDNARLTGERLLCHVLGVRRVDLYVNFDRPLSADELAAFKHLLKRRLSFEPLQYIIGETEFFSLSFNVGPGVLIPRPETELLVEKVIDYGRTLTSCRILDIGTGSGCIAVSLAKHLELARITAIDNSEQALDQARENAEKNQVLDRIQFLLWDFFSDQLPFSQPFDIVAANPPYISQSDYDELAPEIRNFEPNSALLAGADGLDAYHALKARLSRLLEPGGKAFFEIGADQAAALHRLFQNLIILQDFAGRDRLAVITRSGEPDIPTKSV
jgi:release factor glutamine methyltransferase